MGGTVLNAERKIVLILKAPFAFTLLLCDSLAIIKFVGLGFCLYVIRSILFITSVNHRDYNDFRACNANNFVFVY